MFKLLKYVGVDFCIEDKLSKWEEKKEIMLEDKIWFNLVDDVGIVGLQYFGQVMINIVPDY